MHFRDVDFFLFYQLLKTNIIHFRNTNPINKIHNRNPTIYPFPTSKGPLEKPSTFCSNIFPTQHVKKRPRNPLLLQHLDVFFIFILQLGLKIFDTSIFGVNDLSTGTLLKLELIIQLLAIKFAEELFESRGGGGRDFIFGSKVNMGRKGYTVTVENSVFSQERLRMEVLLDMWVHQKIDTCIFVLQHFGFCTFHH